MPSTLPIDEKTKSKDMQVDRIDDKLSNSDIKSDLVSNMIERLIVRDDVYFKSQQKDEDDLTLNQKRDIANDILNSSKSNFLRRFGKILNVEDLEYFKQFVDTDQDGYEINFFLKQLFRFSENGRKDVKNRRFEAMKQMFTNSTYFSEVEMMKRNPLMYDQLVGQYLTEEEKLERDKNDTDNNSDTLVNIILNGIDKKEVLEMKLKQQELEDDVIEEEEDDSNEDEDIDDNVDDQSEDYTSDCKPSTCLWGAFETDDKKTTSERKIHKTNKKENKWYHINDQEKQLLREEFFSNMYQNFLDGKDTDFDYTTVDFNTDYDCVKYGDQDEEDKYFDSESPENTQMDTGSGTQTVVDSNDTSEDELDVYMKHLNQNPTVCQLTKDLKRM